MEKTVELCIVGAAGAGMSAAITAAQHGVKNILVLEKMKNPGGCTVMSAGMMGFNTPAQRRFGVHFDVDEEFQKLMRVHNWRSDAKLVRKWLNESGENFEWLEDLGLEYAFCTTESADPATHKPSHNRTGFWDGEKWVMKMHGPLIVKCLRESCAKYGVEIMTETRARHLLQDDSGRVCGVRAEGPEGELVVHAEAVILATGSISGNQDLIRRFYATEEYRDIRVMANVPHNTGDGLIMAEEAGAAEGRIGTLFIGPHNHYPQASELVGMLMRRPQPTKVNQNGERFCNEALPLDEDFGWMMSVSVDSQPGKKCFIIFDKKYLDKVKAGTDYLPPRYDTGCMLYAPPKLGGTICPVEKGQDESTWRERVDAHIEYEQERGHARICKTLEEVAEFVGCDHEVLQKTIEEYNAYCARGYDADFLKNPAYLEPLTQAPYTVILGRSGIDTCLGGVKIDNHQRVMNKKGRPIPGLYAAGVMCSGWFNDSYCYFGSEMSFTVYSGRSAGREAAAWIKTK
ncbi:MAG: FAD-dependent oxidoreductase [Oscillospiraceae bacterium]